MVDACCLRRNSKGRLPSFGCVRAEAEAALPGAHLDVLERVAEKGTAAPRDQMTVGIPRFLAAANRPIHYHPQSRAKPANQCVDLCYAAGAGALRPRRNKNARCLSSFARP